MEERAISNYPVRDGFKIGESATLSMEVTDAAVQQFAILTQDTNPVHLDKSYADKTRFKGRIAHGMLAAGLISAVLGTKLPGPGAIYITQTIRFLAPVYLGETLTAQVVVSKWNEGKNIITMDLRCYSGKDKNVIQGEAVLLYEPVR